MQTVDTPVDQRARFSLSDADVIELARYAMIIEDHYGRPMDIEWGKDGNDGQLFILQARPETVKSQSREGRQQRFTLKGTSDVLDQRARHRPAYRRRDRCAWSATLRKWSGCRPATCWSPT